MSRKTITSPLGLKEISPENYLTHLFKKKHWKLVNGKPVPKRGSLASKILPNETDEELFSSEEKMKNFEKRVLKKLKECSKRRTSRRRNH
jgi:hypothetical protein